MYLTTIKKDGQIIAIRHFEYFENAMAYVADHEAFDDIPDEIINAMGEWGSPKIYCHSINEETQLADDFEFKYPCGIIIYIGKIMTEEEKMIAAKERADARR